MFAALRLLLVQYKKKSYMGHMSRNRDTADTIKDHASHPFSFGNFMIICRQICYNSHSYSYDLNFLWELIRTASFDSVISAGVWDREDCIQAMRGSISEAEEQQEKLPLLPPHSTPSQVSPFNSLLAYLSSSKRAWLLFFLFSSKII